MNKFICRVSYCNYPEGQCLEGCDQIYPLMRMLEPPAEQESVQDEYNRVINHAIEQGIEASVFLRCWQEGDWSGCAEFGFEPNMAAYTAPQPAIPPGYKLVPIQKLVELKASIHGEYFRGTDWELETISTMLIAKIDAAHEAKQDHPRP